MEFIKTELDGCYVIKPQVLGNEQSWFVQSWCQKEFEAHDLNYNFVDERHSFTAKTGTLRGINFQAGDAAQAKLINCIRGAVLDVAVDLRETSPTFKKWISVQLSAENREQLLIPRGFGHGFVTLTDDVEIICRADRYYDEAAERSILWNDTNLNINWGISNPILSNKDKNAPAPTSANLMQ